MTPISGLPNRNMQASGLPRRDVANAALVVRRGGGGFNYIQAKDWCTVKQDLPTTTFNQPAHLTAQVKKASYANYHSGGFSNYDYTLAAGTIKSIVTFPSALTAASLWRLLIGSGFTLAAQMAAASVQVTSGLHTFVLNSVLRVQPILAAYDVSALTWNAFIATPPTLDTPVYIDAPGDSYQLGPTLFSTPYGMNVAVIGDTGDLDQTFDNDCFGLLIDCGIALTADSYLQGGALTANGMQVNATVESPIAAAHGNPIYALQKPASI